MCLPVVNSLAACSRVFSRAAWCDSVRADERNEGGGVITCECEEEEGEEEYSHFGILTHAP